MGEKKLFNVVLAGEIKEGFDKSTVKSNLANLFKLPLEKVGALLNGQPLVVKGSVDTDTAAKYKVAIERAGAACRLEAIGFLNTQGSVKMSATQAAEGIWYYEENGQKKGPVSEREMIQFIKSSAISRGSPVWKKGFPDWVKIENTDLRIHLDDSAPPPLSGEHINNTLVWVLAFAPIIGLLLEYVVAGAQYGGNERLAAIAVKSNKYWLISLALNIGLAFFDEKRLKKAGHNTDKFKGWVWLVPVYLYQRAQATKQNLAYFIVWIVCFGLTLLN